MDISPHLTKMIMWVGHSVKATSISILNEPRKPIQNQTSDKHASIHPCLAVIQAVLDKHFSPPCCASTSPILGIKWNPVECWAFEKRDAEQNSDNDMFLFDTDSYYRMEIRRR